MSRNSFRLSGRLVNQMEPKHVRLNRLIQALEAEEPAFATFVLPTKENAVSISDSGYTGAIIEMEHNAFDVRAAQDFMQYLINPRTIMQNGPAPDVTPIVRIPANGIEANEWMAKQVLDAGAYGVVWPHIDTVEQARRAVAACRYPRFSQTEPELGTRGCAPFPAARYMATTPYEYYTRVGGVWPLDRDGEIIVVLMIESPAGVNNIEQILAEVPGIGIVFVGPGDLSQAYGIYGQYDNPIMVDACRQVLKASTKAGVACGITALNSKLVDVRLAEGYRFIVTSPRTVNPDFAHHRATLAGGVK